ncbi:hypothetical protein D3C81_1022350 [compost metagenome]
MGAEHHVGLAGAGASRQHYALVRRDQLDGALLRHILAGHRHAPELGRLPRFEVLTDQPHHPGDLSLGSMPQGMALVAGQWRRLAAGIGRRQLFRREEAHLRLVVGGLLFLCLADLVGDAARGVLAAHAQHGLSGHLPQHVLVDLAVDEDRIVVGRNHRRTRGDGG